MRPHRLLLAVALLVCPLVAAAQQSAKPQNGAIKGFRGEFLANLTDVQDKLMDLAETVPADAYAWRPAEGVRSIGEVYMHVAGGNYFLATFLGVKTPADVPKDLEKITDKQRVLTELRKSFDFLRGVAQKQNDADLEKAVKLFGSQTSQRGVYVTMLNHVHEHLGQSIAYARMNGVAPPWSR